MCIRDRLELALNDFAGVINVAGTQALSRYEMGQRLARHLGLDAGKITAGLSLGSGLARPRNCTLDVRLAQRLLHTPLLSYDEGLGGYLENVGQIAGFVRAARAN